MSNGKKVRGISSPMGRLAFAKQQEKKVLTVDDPTVEDEVEDSEEQYRKELEAARKAKQEAQVKATPQAINRLEILAGIGRLGTEITIDNITFSLKSLKAREMREIMVAASKVENAVEQAFEMRANTIARAIDKVNGQPFDIILGSDDLDFKIAFVQELDEKVLVKLHNEYTAMVSDSNSKIEEDLGKTAEEVSETVKKS